MIATLNYNSSLLIRNQKSQCGLLIDEPMVRLDLRIGIKHDIDPTIFQIKFNNLQEMYDNHVFLYTYGSSLNQKMLSGVLP